MSGNYIISQMLSLINESLDQAVREALTHHANSCSEYNSRGLPVCLTYRLLPVVVTVARLPQALHPSFIHSLKIHSREVGLI